MFNRLRAFMNKPRHWRKPDMTLDIILAIGKLEGRIKSLESRPMTTTYEGDHKAIETNKQNIDSLYSRFLEADKSARVSLNHIIDRLARHEAHIEAAEYKIKQLEAAPISKKIRAITARTSKSKTKRNGRMAGRHANP